MAKEAEQTRAILELDLIRLEGSIDRLGNAVQGLEASIVFEHTSAMPQPEKEEPTPLRLERTHKCLEDAGNTIEGYADRIENVAVTIRKYI